MESTFVGSGPWHLGTIKDTGDATPHSIFVSDGPCGLATRHHLQCLTTSFPCPLALAASWDLGIVRQVASAIGHEAYSVGVNLVLGPCVNIIRHPLGGRTFECFSEDPLLSSQIAETFVHGLQVDASVGACVKHFLCNNQEKYRKSIDIFVSERAMREIYLPSFRSCTVNAKAAAVMTSYNKVHSFFASESKYLLSEILRDEWGYEGLVISDWGACHDLSAAIIAGLDVKMPGPPSKNDLNNLAQCRQSHMMQTAASRSAQNQALLLQHFPVQDHGNSVPDKILRQNYLTSCEAARASIVLLKNNRSALPLIGVQRVAVLGPRAISFASAGGGSSWIQPAKEPQNAVQALRGILGKEIELLLPSSFENISEAEDLAASSEASVVFVGYPPRYEGEGSDRPSLALPELDDEIVEAVCSVCRRTIVVLFVGSPVAMPWLSRAAAVLVGWYPGASGAKAIAEVISGCAPVTGFLPISWWKDVPDSSIAYPCTDPPPKAKLHYSEDVFVGYRHPETSQHCHFRFGHGLCFSHTQLYNTSLSPDSVGSPTSHFTVLTTLQNVGNWACSFVVQIFITPPNFERRPKRELRSWHRTSMLSPEEEENIVLEISPHSLSYYDQKDGKWLVEEGRYIIELWCASSSKGPSAVLPLIVTKNFFM